MQKYFVHLRGQVIACLAFAGAGWKVAPRDAWIGWSRQRREANLRVVIHDTRCLILPRIKLPNLASRILSLIARRLPDDGNRIGHIAHS